MISSLVRNTVLCAAIVALFTASVSADEITRIEDSAAVLSQYGNPICGGTVIATAGAHEIIATAAHCIEAEPDTVSFLDGDHGPIDEQLVSDSADVAIVVVKSMHRHPAAHIVARLPRRNDDLLVFGLPSGEMWSVSRAYDMQGAYPVALDMPDDSDGMPFPWPDAFLIGCDTCYHGDSGGGVFRHGNLIGLLVGGQGQGHAFVEPAQDILDLIKIVEASAG